MNIRMRINKWDATKAIRQVGKLSGLSNSIIGVLLFGFSLGVAFEEIVGIGSWHSFGGKTEKLNVCFTPPSGCGSLIVREITEASSSIYLQAYSFTSKPILSALTKAALRGVKVEILLDSSNLHDRDSNIAQLQRFGIPVFIDKISGIAHNKVIIIDEKKVITGSFNFTSAADTHNAENVLLVDDDRLAEEYLRNWFSRKNKAQQFQSGEG